MKKLELTYEQVELLRDCLHTQLVDLYEKANTTTVTALANAIHGVISQIEDIDELLKF